MAPCPILVQADTQASSQMAHPYPIRITRVPRCGRVCTVCTLSSVRLRDPPATIPVSCAIRRRQLLEYICKYPQSLSVSWVTDTFEQIHDSDMFVSPNSRIERFINTPAHHTLHHLYFTCNYGQVRILILPGLPLTDLPSNSISRWPTVRAGHIVHRKPIWTQC